MHRTICSSFALILAASLGAVRLAAAAAPPTINASPNLPATASRATAARPLPAAMQKLATVPVMKYLREEGDQAIPLGYVAGMTGWLLIHHPKGSSVPEFQTIYVSKSGKHAIAGIAFDAKGTDVTEEEIAAAHITNAPIIGALAPTGLQANVSGTAPLPVSKPPLPINASTMPAPAPSTAPAAGQKPKAAGTSTKAVAASAQPNGTAPAPYVAATEKSEKVKISPSVFYGALNKTYYFTLGYPNRPDLVMFADPTCPVCHAAWSILMPLVANKKLDLTVVYVDILKGSHQPTLDVLAGKNTGLKWLSGEGSETGVPIPTPPAAELPLAKIRLGLNRKFAIQASVTKTPTLFWVTPDKAVYRATGLRGVAAFLDAVQHHKALGFNGRPIEMSAKN